MANDNFYPGQVPGQSLGTGEGEAPLAKPVVPNTDVRTMASDMRSINTGSPAPKPYAPQASAPDNIPVAPMPSVPVPDQSFQIPQTDASGNQPGDPTPKKSSKGIFTVLVIVIVVAGLAALGYFVIYPIFFSAPAAPETPPAAANPEPTPPTAEPAVPVPTPVPAPAHVSLLTTPADSQIEVTTITNGAKLANLNLNTTASPSITEVIYKDTDGNLKQAAAEILQEVSGAAILATSYKFNDSGTAGLVYVDKNNARWLGFVLQLADSTDVEAQKTGLQTILEGFNFINLFATDPGTAQTWKDGQIAGVTGNRYLLFDKPGFVVDYGWVGNKLLIFASYDGFKEAVRRLQ